MCTPLDPRARAAQSRHLVRQVVVLLATCVVASVAAAQATAAAVAATIAAWTHLDAPPGGESRAVATLTKSLPGWSDDGFGNLVKRVGSGSPRRVVACAMDVPGFVVSAITDDGFVRLHHTGTPLHQLWDQFHEAQQIRILTRRGDVSGVVAIANGHFARQHRGDTAVVNVDQFWVDLGVSLGYNRRCDEGLIRLGLALVLRRGGGQRGERS